MSAQIRNRRNQEKGVATEIPTTNSTSTINTKTHSSKCKFCLLLLVIFICFCIIGPFFIPEVNPIHRVTEKDLADADSKFINLLGFDIHYKEKGTGETVFILLHGFSTHTFTWRKVMEPLSKFGRVIAFDRIGQGLSAHPVIGEWTGRSPYAPSMQPEFVNALMEKLKIKNAFLIGNSQGGSVVLRTALAYPSIVNGIVVIAADWHTSGIMPSGKYSWLWNTKQMRKLGTWIAEKLLGETNAEYLISLGWFNATLFTAQELQAALPYFRVRNFAASLWEYAAANEVSPLDDLVAKISVPTLVVAGEDDQVVPYEDQVLLATLIPNSTLVSLKHCGHLPHEERVEQFLEAVVKFVDKSKQASLIQLVVVLQIQQHFLKLSLEKPHVFLLLVLLLILLLVPILSLNVLKLINLLKIMFKNWSIHLISNI